MAGEVDNISQREGEIMIGLATRGTAENTGVCALQGVSTGVGSVTFSPVADATNSGTDELPTWPDSAGAASSNLDLFRSFDKDFDTEILYGEEARYSAAAGRRALRRQREEDRSDASEGW